MVVLRSCFCMILARIRPFGPKITADSKPSARKRRPHLRLRGFAHKPAVPMPFYAPYAESQSHQRALRSAHRGWCVLAFARFASSGAWAKTPVFAARVPESGPAFACAALRTSRRCRCLSMHHTLNRNRTNARGAVARRPSGEAV